MYFGKDFQVPSNNVKVVRVIVQKGQPSKLQLFPDKLKAQQPVVLTNLQIVLTDTVFLKNLTHPVCMTRPQRFIHHIQGPRYYNVYSRRKESFNIH